MSERGIPDPALPQPDAAAAQHSARLRQVIAAEMAAAGGRLSFARYMELALYAPGLGYYSGGATKLGAAGDFITAPETSPLFARCLARQAAQVLAELDGGEVLEVGAGSGVMAADLLTALAAADCLPRRYLILERSAELRARQQALLQARLPALRDRIVWLEGLPEAGFRGVVIANELLDALPVHLFTLTAAGAVERYVEERGGQWRWGEGPFSDPALAERIVLLQRERDLPLGYTSEINLAAEAWVRSISERLAAGLALLIDYGFPRREYYHPQRSGGTLMCHYRHRAHQDPLILTGLQDITAHLDFTALAEAGHEAGLEVAGYTTQGAFLLAAGITEYVNETAEEPARLQAAQQVKKLTLPHEMGELFKVLALSRGLREPLLGFAWRDLRDRL
jgi:SAM-dependent MidA family methyltransferase